MRKYIQIVEAFMGDQGPARAFGRRNAPPEAPTAYEPRDPALRAKVQRARQYPTAEAYAEDNDPFEATNTDPLHIQQRSEAERARLVRQWTLWKSQGFIV